MKRKEIALDAANTLILTEISNGWGMPRTDYAVIINTALNCEWGFISPEGIFLKMENPAIGGHWEKIPLAADSVFTVRDRVDRFVKHYRAIYDRYMTIIRGK